MTFAAPGVVYDSFLFWSPDEEFGLTTPFLSLILCLPKIFDPILAVLIIEDYRKGMLKAFGLYKG